MGMDVLCANIAISLSRVCFRRRATTAAASELQAISRLYDTTAYMSSEDRGGIDERPQEPIAKWVIDADGDREDL